MNRNRKGSVKNLKSRFWLNLFLVLVGVVLGTMIAHVSAGNQYFSWLAFGQNFGTTAPVTLELGVISLTIGLNFSISVATILCIAVSLVVGKYIFKK